MKLSKLRLEIRSESQPGRYAAFCPLCGWGEEEQARAAAEEKVVKHLKLVHCGQREDDCN